MTRTPEKFMSTEQKPAFSPGLAGVIAGETEICWVDPNAGLMYRGYDIHEMADKASFEEVAYLLLKGQLPNMGELQRFRMEIAAARPLPKEVLEYAAAVAEKNASDGYAAHRRFHARALRSRPERQLARGQHPQGDSPDRAGFDADHGRLPHFVRSRSPGGAPGPDRGGQSFLQTERRSAAGLESPDDGHDPDPLRRSRIQRLDLCRPRDGFDPGRHVCRGHERLRDA